MKNQVIVVTNPLTDILLYQGWLLPVLAFVIVSALTAVSLSLILEKVIRRQISQFQSYAIVVLCLLFGACAFAKLMP